jgi:hypothetical protein
MHSKFWMHHEVVVEPLITPSHGIAEKVAEVEAVAVVPAPVFHWHLKSAAPP